MLPGICTLLRQGCFTVLLLLCLPVFAETHTDNTAEQKPIFWQSGSFYQDFMLQQEKALETSKIVADRSQETISERLHRFSGVVDKFFAEDNYTIESKDSRMRVSLANRYQRFYDPALEPRMSLSLALPNTKRHWRLRFQSDDESFEDHDSSLIQQNNLAESITSTSFTTALGLMLETSELINIQFDAGIRFRTPIDPFTRFRARRTFHWHDLKFRVAETLQWRKSYGNTAETQVEFETPIFQSKYLYRTTTQITYWDINSYLSASQSFTFYQPLTDKSAIAYTFGVAGQNEDELHLKKKDQLNSYWIETRYRKNFYSNWLFYQITPGITRERDYDFRNSPRIEFKIEAVYGYGSST